MGPPLRTAPVERHTSREAAGRAGPDMAEGRVFMEPRGEARSCGGAAAGCANESWEATAGRGCSGHSGSREPSSRAFPGRLGPGSSALFLRQRPSSGLRPHGTTAGCGARLGGPVPAPSAAAGIPRAAGEASLITGGAGTAGEVTLLRKSKLLSWHVPRPEGVHPSAGTLVGMRGWREPRL